MKKSAVFKQKTRRVKYEVQALIMDADVLEWQTYAIFYENETPFEEISKWVTEFVLDNELRVEDVRILEQAVTVHQGINWRCRRVAD